VAAGSLLAGLARGYYLLDAAGAGSFDPAADRFELPVCGFAVNGGRAVAPVSRAVLAGGIGALLRGVQAVARDLAFLPLDGMIGSPSLLVTGLALHPAGPDPEDG
jgi:predicted Zn-dependent protease